MSEFAPQPCPPAPKPLLLFLDDNLQLLAMYQAFFERKGYAVLTSTRGSRAIELAQSNPVKVAVVDYEMPEMNGHEAAVALKRILPALPVIMVSGNGNIPREAWNAVDFFVSKDAGQQRLAAIIEGLLES